jgi:hypothetical protein
MTGSGLTWRGLAVTVLTIFCAQCRTPGSREVPARFPRQADDTCRTELTEFVSAEVHGHVELMPETFTDSDRLLISRVTRRGPDGRLLDGRSLEMPEEFRLTRAGMACTIVHLRTGRRAELPACQCIETRRR